MTAAVCAPLSLAHVLFEQEDDVASASPALQPAHPLGAPLSSAAQLFSDPSASSSPLSPSHASAAVVGAGLAAAEAVVCCRAVAMLQQLGLQQHSAAFM